MSGPFRVNELIAYVHDDGNKYIIKPTGDGYLNCTECPENRWCEHIQGCILTGQDAEQVWRRVSIDRTSFIMVPLMPSADVWPMLNLDRMATSDEIFKVILMGYMPALERKGLSEFVGFLSKGEGRIHLRQLIIAWFEPLVSGQTLEKIRCQSNRHTWNIEMQVAKDAADRTMLFLHCWHLVFNNACARCSAVTDGRSALHEFDPSLIPGV